MSIDEKHPEVEGDPVLTSECSGPSREEVAYHEAAHAVVAVLAKATPPIERIVIAKCSNGWLGEVLPRDENIPYYSPEALVAAALKKAAGHYGHDQYLESDPLRRRAFTEVWSRDDREGVLFIAKEATFDDIDPDPFVDDHPEIEWAKRIEKQASEMVNGNWDLVVRVASALLAAPETAQEIEDEGTKEAYLTPAYELSGKDIETLVFRR